MIYSDEEVITEEAVKKSPAKIKKPRKTRPKKPKVQPEVVIAKPPDQTPSYSLRVLRSSVDRTSPTVTSYSLRSSSRANFSSDDDADFSSMHHVKVSTPTGNPVGRMALSEARFRADIDKLKHSSTPFTEDTTTTRSKRRNPDRTLETTTTRVTRKTTTPDPLDTISGGSAIQEEEEEVVTIVTKETPPASEPGAAWLEVGWKEVGLAGFLSSIGVLGYICYVSDVCGYC